MCLVIVIFMVFGRMRLYLSDFFCFYFYLCFGIWKVMFLFLKDIMIVLVFFGVKNVFFIEIIL